MTGIDTARMRELHADACSCCPMDAELLDSIPQLLDEVDDLRLRMNAVTRLADHWARSKFHADYAAVLREILPSREAIGAARPPRHPAAPIAHAADMGGQPHQVPQEEVMDQAPLIGDAGWNDTEEDE